MTLWLVGFAHLSDLLLFGYITCCCFETSLLDLSEAEKTYGKEGNFPTLLSVFGTFYWLLCL